jgi:putative ABC transport system permease protein
VGTGRGTLLEVAVSVHRVLLWCYPSRIRGRYGEELERIFETRARQIMAEGGVLGLLAFGLGAWADVVRSGLAERMQPTATVRGERKRIAVGEMMSDLLREIRHAFRGLVRSPAFTVAAVLTMGLGIGANTAIFSVVRAVLLQPLPYEDPGRLVLVWGEMTQRNVTYFPHSPPDLVDIREMSTTLEAVAGVVTFPQPLAGDGEAVQVTVGIVTPNTFSVLGIAPLRGRDFNEEDGAPAQPDAQPGDAGFLNQIAILDHDLWQNRFGGEPGVLGSIIDLGGSPTEVVGVMPPGFRVHMPALAALASDVDVWVAARINYETANRSNVFLRMIGRTRPGVTLPQAQADLDRIAATLRERFAVKETSGYALGVVRMHEDIVAGVRPIILALLGAVMFVLLIACANVANLMLVRSSSRERELAVRAAVGGSRWRLVRQVLTESVLLSVAGGVVGTGLAAAGIHVLGLLQPDALPRTAPISMDPLVLLWTGASVLIAAALFGLVPALRASRPAIVDVLREGGRSPGLRGNRLMRNGVIVAEVALSLILLIGAGLMVRTFIALQQVDPGYEPEGVLTFDVPLPFGRYPGADRRAAVTEQLHERLAALPGVESVTAGSPLPLNGALVNGRWGPPEAMTDPQAFRQANYFFVLPGYFEALRTEVVAGRSFTWAEHRDSAAVIVIDERLAEIAFPDRSAVGERLLLRVSTEPESAEVIGVVRHQRHESLAADGRETIYFTDRFGGSFGATWAIRTGAGDPARLIDAIRAEVAAIDPLLPVANVRPLVSYVDDAMAATRFALTLMGVFAGIALAMAAIGLYGVLAYTVRQRTAEIGVRMAFGARASTILRLVVSQGLGLSAIGLVIGVGGAVVLTRVMASLLVGVTPTDPLTFAAITLLFMFVAACASFIPAWRASRVDPVRALRQE